MKGCSLTGILKRYFSRLCYAPLMGKKDIISKEAIKRIAVDLVARVQDTGTGIPYLLHMKGINEIRMGY